MLAENLFLLNEGLDLDLLNIVLETMDLHIDCLKFILSLLYQGFELSCYLFVRHLLFPHELLELLLLLEVDQVQKE